MKQIIITVTIFLIYCVVTSECQNFGGSAAKTGFDGGVYRSPLNSRIKYRNPTQYQQNPSNNELNPNVPPAIESGISTIGLISIITLIIVLGFVAYWGIICYPLFFHHERNYDIMHSSSTHTTPTISGEFEKSGNYSSRSTTPSHSNE